MYQVFIVRTMSALHFSGTEHSNATGIPIDHVERTFQSFPGAHYILPSDDTERERLALQHNVLKHAFEGRILLPSIALLNEDKVLECGSGSGVWILDLADQVPRSVTMQGIDIESRLFPTSPPENARFSIGSVTSLPSEWDDTFVLAHQRLLIAGLQRSEWKTALKELYRVISPSGWIQLGEVGSWAAGPVTNEHISLVQRLFSVKGLLLDCAAHLPVMLQEAGFVNVHVEERSIPLGKWAGQDGIDGRDDFIGVFRGMKTPILKAGGLGYVESEAEFDFLLDAVEKEWDETPGANIKFFVFYAQKIKASLL